MVVVTTNKKETEAQRQRRLQQEEKDRLEKLAPLSPDKKTTEGKDNGSSAATPKMGVPDVPPVQPSPQETDALKTSQRDFKPPPNSTVVERDAKGNPTVYRDKEGERYYTPFNPMWDLGYKTFSEYKKRGAEMGGERVVITEGDKTRAEVRYEAPYVAVKTEKGEAVHLTKAEVRALEKLPPEERFYQYQQFNMVPSKAEFVGVDDKGQIQYMIPRTRKIITFPSSAPKEERAGIYAGGVVTQEQIAELRKVNPVQADLIDALGYTKYKTEIAKAENRLAEYKNKDGDYNMVPLLSDEAYDKTGTIRNAANLLFPAEDLDDLRNQLGHESIKGKKEAAAYFEKHGRTQPAPTSNYATVITDKVTNFYDAVVAWLNQPAYKTEAEIEQAIRAMPAAAAATFNAVIDNIDAHTHGIQKWLNQPADVSEAEAKAAIGEVITSARQIIKNTRDYYNTPATKVMKFLNQPAYKTEEQAADAIKNRVNIIAEYYSVPVEKVDAFLSQPGIKTEAEIGRWASAQAKDAQQNVAYKLNEAEKEIDRAENWLNQPATKTESEIADKAAPYLNRMNKRLKVVGDWLKERVGLSANTIKLIVDDASRSFGTAGRDFKQWLNKPATETIDFKFPDTVSQSDAIKAITAIATAGVLAPEPASTGGGLIVLAILTALGLSAVAGDTIKQYHGTNNREPAASDIKITPSKEQITLPPINPARLPAQEKGLVPPRIAVKLEGIKGNTIVIAVPGIKATEESKPFGVAGYYPNYDRPVIMVPGIGAMPKELSQAERILTGNKTAADLFTKAQELKAADAKLNTLVKKLTVKTLGPDDVGLTEEQFRRMVRQRVYAPKEEVPATNWDMVVADMVKTANQRAAAEILRKAKEHDERLERMVLSALAKLRAMAKGRATIKEAQAAVARYLEARGNKPLVYQGKTTTLAGVITNTSIKQAMAKGMTKTQAQAMAKAETLGMTETLTKAEVETLTKTLTKTATKTATKTTTKTATKTAVRSATAVATVTPAIPAETTVPAETTPPPPPPPPVPLPKKPTDKQKREYILASGGAIAWYQGKVNNKDRWDTITHPFEDNSDYLMVLGEAPEGATIVTRGKGSAYKTAQVLYGSAPKKKLLVDSGFQDVSIIPISKKKFKIRFTPDPKLESKGDITIGNAKGLISDRPENITGKAPAISMRGMRISPKMPKLGS